jgi:hypothetical protein
MSGAATLAHENGAGFSWNDPVWRSVDLHTNRGENSIMTRILASSALALVVIAGSAPAEAKGCLKGAVVGGAAGHVAGHHGVLGAAAGCLVGRHRANKQAQLRTNQMPAR